MNDQEIGKRIVEEEHVALFLGAYASAGGERLQNIQSGETPDFVGKDTQGRTVGIELTQLRFGPNERHMRRIFEPAPHDPDAWSRLLELLHKKTQSLAKGRWSQCERKILVIFVIDADMANLTAGIDTDAPDENVFDEIWLADLTQVDMFGAVDLFAVVHPELKGHFSTGNRGQKPHG